MPPQLVQFTADILHALMGFFAPAGYSLLATATALIIIVNPLPLSPHDEGDETTMDVMLMWLRKLLILAMILLLLVLPVVIWMMFGAVYSERYQSPDKAAGAWLFDTLVGHGWRLVLGVVAGSAFRAIHQRYVAPYLSDRMRDMRILTATDQVSDVREAFVELRAKTFDPKTYYKDGQFFFGLDREGLPIHLPVDVVNKTNCQFVGPTRFGKGVELGVLLDQAVGYGHTVVYVDPKHDEWLPWVLWHAAGPRTRFVTIDLRDAKHGWHPFMGGTYRDRRARLVAAAGLHDAGTDADFYKQTERGILDRILPLSNGSIRSLLDALQATDTDGKPLKEKAGRLYEFLQEWSSVPALTPAQKGLSVRDVLLNGWVMYFAGDLSDRALRKATRIFIMELLQQAAELREERTTQLTIAIDELKFLISQELSDALATALQNRVNMLVLHQSIEDLRGPEDTSLNAVAIEKSVLVNCQIKLLYRCDPETAEWAAKMSGTRRLTVTRKEGLTVNEFGGETWDGERMVGVEEEALIPENTLLTLPPMVGVLYTPQRLASVVFTAPVTAPKEGRFDEAHPAYARRLLAQREDGKPAAPAAPAPEVAKPLPVESAPKPAEQERAAHSVQQPSAPPAAVKLSAQAHAPPAPRPESAPPGPPRPVASSPSTATPLPPPSQHQQKPKQKKSGPRPNTPKL
jgi:hypothetical protein